MIRAGVRGVLAVARTRRLTVPCGGRTGNVAIPGGLTVPCGGRNGGYAGTAGGPA